MAIFCDPRLTFNNSSAIFIVMLQVVVRAKWLFGDSDLSCESAEDDADHRPADVGCVVAWGAFVVAGAATVAGDPGQGPFHYPTPW